jgi:hypothetical protein
MIHREFIRLFYENMELDARHGYLINWNGRRCYVDVEDTAFVVWGISSHDRGSETDAHIILVLSDDSQEELKPETLFIGKGNVPYCKIKNGAFPARFNRAAYYQLAEHIKEENGAYYVHLRGEKHFIEAGDTSP